MVADATAHIASSSKIYPIVVNIIYCLVISLDIDSLDYFFLLKYLL